MKTYVHFFFFARWHKSSRTRSWNQCVVQQYGRNILLLIHCNNSYVNEIHYYFICTYPVLCPNWKSRLCYLLQVISLKPRRQLYVPFDAFVSLVNNVPGFCYYIMDLLFSKSPWSTEIFSFLYIQLHYNFVLIFLRLFLSPSVCSAMLISFFFLCFTSNSPPPSPVVRTHPIHHPVSAMFIIVLCDFSFVFFFFFFFFLYRWHMSPCFLILCVCSRQSISSVWSVAHVVG